MQAIAQHAAQHAAQRSAAVSRGSSAAPYVEHLDSAVRSSSIEQTACGYAAAWGVSTLCVVRCCACMSCVAAVLRLRICCSTCNSACAAAYANCSSSAEHKVHNSDTSVQGARCTAEGLSVLAHSYVAVLWVGSYAVGITI